MKIENDTLHHFKDAVANFRDLPAKSLTVVVLRMTDKNKAVVVAGALPEGREVDVSQGRGRFAKPSLDGRGIDFCVNGDKTHVKRLFFDRKGENGNLLLACVDRHYHGYFASVWVYHNGYAKMLAGPMHRVYRDIISDHEEVAPVRQLEFEGTLSEVCEEAKRKDFRDHDKTFPDGSPGEHHLFHLREVSEDGEITTVVKWRPKFNIQAEEESATATG